jgi:branched-chain amino acid transport system substrate-binding protein
MVTWECALNYTGMHALARAIAAAGSTTDIYRIRASFPKAFPLLGDKFPNEAMGINEAGRMYIGASVQTITNGKFDPSELYVWWPKSQKEFDQAKKQTKFTKNPMKWMKVSL